jgi:hypothetical protein
VDGHDSIAPSLVFVNGSFLHSRVVFRVLSLVNKSYDFFKSPSRIICETDGYRHGRSALERGSKYECHLFEKPRLIGFYPVAAGHVCNHTRAVLLPFNEFAVGAIDFESNEIDVRSTATRFRDA